MRPEAYRGIVHAEWTEYAFLQELSEGKPRKVLYKHLSEAKAIVAVGSESSGIVLER